MFSKQNFLNLILEEGAIMISINAISYLKAVAELQADVIPGGILFVIAEGDTFIWRKASKFFDPDIFQVGQKVRKGGTTERAMKENGIAIANLPRSVYGTRIRVISESLVSEEGQAVGAFTFVLPIIHPVAKSFKDFAPILAEMLPEGAFLYISDLHKVIRRQGSRKFDVSTIQLNYELKEDDIASNVIKSKRPISMKVDSSKYGVPVLIISYPLFDEDNSNEVVGTLGLIIPKVLAGNLRDMSNNLKDGLEEIASAIEQLAASASNIHINEQKLDTDIKEITELSDEINEVSTFIKTIANETNMLGLNAAIEAARAGEAGRGFGVVAKEIRKLSDQSKDTVPQIIRLTDSIKKKVEKTTDESRNSLGSIQEQAAATEEVTASIQEMSAMSEELNKIAQEL
ncbi:putative sensory transducer protein YfmS [Clostridium sp. BL-8]|nr:putative sensory transducer protein YfmS [Clostridium sp. BL-8]